MKITKTETTQEMSIQLYQCLMIRENQNEGGRLRTTAHFTTNNRFEHATVTTHNHRKKRCKLINIGTSTKLLMSSTNVYGNDLR